MALSYCKRGAGLGHVELQFRLGVHLAVGGGRVEMERVLPGGKKAPKHKDCFRFFWPVLGGPRGPGLAQLVARKHSFLVIKYGPNLSNSDQIGDRFQFFIHLDEKT